MKAIPVMLVPLDATNHVQVTEEFLQRFEKDRQTPEPGFVYRLLASDPDYVRGGTYFFWDPLAAVSLAVEGVVTYEPKKVRAGVSADRQKFEAAFLDTLNARVSVP